jgi:hypothetical protein
LKCSISVEGVRSVVQPIAEWLANIGVEQYAPAFADNDIDVSVLPHLTDADLEKIGVSLGHRRKILAAVADTRTEPKRRETAERRQLTDMLSELVGSTALSARMRPADLSGASPVSSPLRPAEVIGGRFCEAPKHRRSRPLRPMIATMAISRRPRLARLMPITMISRALVGGAVLAQQ